MPQDIVHTQLTAETASQRQPTYNDVVVIGTATAQPPNAAFGEVNRYSDSDSVLDDYGDGTDVHVTSQNLQVKGAEYWYVQQLEAVEAADEEIADGDTIDNTPILGDHDVTSPDGTPVFVTEDPVAVPGDDEIAINAETGGVEIGANLTYPVTLTYYHADWSQLDNVPDNANLVGLADRRMTRQHIGVLDEVQTWASGRRMGMAVNGPNTDDYADLDTAREATADVAGYVPSGDLMMVVDRSSDDLASYVLGELAINDPWHNPYRDAIPAGTPLRRQVGDPATTETFEGGDADGNGPVNALISVAGVNRLSNSITTAGEGSQFQFFDVRRTMVFFDQEVNRALESLAANRDQIPFNEDGQSMIEDALVEVYDPYTGGVGNPLASYDITVPAFDDDAVDRENRIWGGIEVDSRLSGSAHEFTIEQRFSA